MVDADIEVVRIYRRAGERFSQPLGLSREADDTLTTPVLPGLEIPLGRVLDS